MCDNNCECHSEQNIYSLKVTYSNETLFTKSEIELKRGDFIVAATRYGIDMLEVRGKVSSCAASDELVEIIRLATGADFVKADNNKYLATEAFVVAKRKINEHDLPMKLIATHYLLEEEKILFLFTADGRIDFRELVKDLVATFHVRIELRQVGVRDESCALGGLAVCGRDYCCHSISDKLKAVSIKMLKDQGLSLNSSKISGNCGRLLCCVAFEHNYYIEQRKLTPSNNSKIRVQGELWKIAETNVISQKITLIADDGRLASYPLNQLKRTGEGWVLIDN
ncbi:MAG: hypothetical protein FWE37_03210 [Spirochaetaceae bacterium]|nr:hypothetical protein [Spirochaetaceae bacterium]